MYLLCLEPANALNSINNSGKNSAGLLLASEEIRGNDNVTTGDSVVCWTNEKVICTSSALGRIETMSHLDVGSIGDALHDSSVQGALCGEEGSTVQGRLAREPIDRSRYVVVNGRSGTTFVCSRCSKQYIHRKSLNKHWNDKHADDSIDRGKYLTSRNCSVSEPVKNPFIVELVQCPSSVHMALSCTSSLVPPAGCSPTNSPVSVAGSQQKTYSDLHSSQLKHSGSIRDSALWHSLAAIHLNEEQNMNSFYCAPMPAHISGHYNARESFLNQLFYDDNCQVLDLSKGSSDLDELSNVSVADAPIDLSLKSNSMCLAGSEKIGLPLHNGIVETVSKSAASFTADVSAVDTVILNETKNSDKWVARFGDSRKNCRPAQLDSVSLLRHLHSGILANATNESVQADSGCCNSVVVSDELKSYHSNAEPLASSDCYHNSMPVKSNLSLISKLPHDFATSKETHDFFGGISRGGYIRCKMCDFSATSMLLFSRHVANHVRKSSISSDSVQDHQCGESRDKECGFFMWLGLHCTNTAAVDTDQRSDDGCHYAEVDCLDTDENLKSRCKTVGTDACELNILEVQGNRTRSSPEVGQHMKNMSIDPVDQKHPVKPGGYKRGLGLTTTESRDAAGRSWRRRRLRTCERCGYVTDNLTTLKRHEVKHGAPGMYRCKLCDYTVNQQHILEYHTRNVHRLPRQIGATNSTLFKHSNVPFVSNIVDERCAVNATTFVGGNQRLSCNNDFPAGDSPIQGGCAAFTSTSEVTTVQSIQYDVNKCSSEKFVSKIVQYPTSVTLAQRCLLDAFGLRLGHGKCVRCGFRSLSSVRMKQHMLRHPHERYVCSMCPYTSSTAELLLKHKRQHTDCRPGYLAQKKTYPCPECPFLATSPNRLQRHTQFHGVKLRHVCGKCSYSVDRANLIAQHHRLHACALKTVQKRCWLHCSKCPFKTINRVLLVNHERGHYSVNCQYTCSLCSFGTDIANVALSHQQLH